MMDFLDPKKRRAHLRQLYIGYALVGIALISATYLLVKATGGFYYDRKTHTVIQNGLVYIGSNPVSSRIVLNGIDKGTTDQRFTVPAGAYNLELQRDGYRTWKHSFTLSGAGLENLVYPVLFPTNLVTKDVDLLAMTPGMATESPDRHWFIAQQGASLTNFEQVDLSSTTNTPTTITLPSGLLTVADGEHKVEVVEWSKDNERILVKHTYNNGVKVEYVIIDRLIPETSTNITIVLPEVEMAQVALRDMRADQLYVLNNSGDLSTISLKNKQITAVASKVLAFKPFASDQMVYVVSNGDQATTATVKLKTGVVTYSLRELAINGTYFLDMASFNGNMFVVVGSSVEGRAYIYRNPLNVLKQTPPIKPTPIALLKVDAAQYISFSKTARFVVLQGGSKFAVYDAEADRQTRYETTLNLDPPAKANWMDGNRLVVLSGGKAVVFDYDGTNIQTLSPALPGYSVFFDRNYKAMYTVALSLTIKDRSALTRTELTAR